MASRYAICSILLVSMISGLQAQTTKSEKKSYTVPEGTRILLSLKREISTRAAVRGDTVYLISDFPVVEDGAVVLPAGMYVKGVIDNVQRPGKVKGRAQLQLHFTTMIFPNGVEIAIPSSLDNVSGSNGAKVKNGEGVVEQSGNKGRDAQTIANTTMEGTGLGAIVGSGTGNVGMGAGVGAGAGAAVGVLTTLFTRGNDIVFPQGTSLEMVLSRPIVVQVEQLTGMPSSTGMTIPSPAPSDVQPTPMTMSKPNR
jgi:type IV secretion system protein VirB10